MNKGYWVSGSSGVPLKGSLEGFIRFIQVYYKGYCKGYYKGCHVFLQGLDGLWSRWPSQRFTLDHRGNIRVSTASNSSAPLL